MTKRTILLPLALLGSLIFTACGGAGGADMSTPLATFNTLTDAIESKDIETYKACFLSDAIESEAMLDLYEKNADEFWKEIQGIFRPPLSVEVTRQEGDEAKLDVEAPEADGGGIGGLTMQNDGGSWKIRAW